MHLAPTADCVAQVAQQEKGRVELKSVGKFL